MTISESLRDTPQTYRVLAEKTGLSRRDVEAEIQRLRLAGIPVVTDSDGARLTADPAEVKACADRLRSRAVHQLLTSRAMRRAARRMADADRLLTLWAA